MTEREWCEAAGEMPVLVRRNQSAGLLKLCDRALAGSRLALDMFRGMTIEAIQARRDRVHAVHVEASARVAAVMAGPCPLSAPSMAPTAPLMVDGRIAGMNVVEWRDRV